MESTNTKMSKKMAGAKGGSSSRFMELDGEKLDIKSILKDIEFLGSSHMTWKEKKELENRKVVSLGGKPPKKQRLPLSVARVTMKKQKERDEKMLQESSILGRFAGKLGGGTKRVEKKRKPEDKVLKSTVGNFRNGVLDVKDLLRTGGAPKDSVGGGGSFSNLGFNMGNKKKGGKKNKSKKGGGHKRH